MRAPLANAHPWQYKAKHHFPSHLPLFSTSSAFAGMARYEIRFSAFGDGQSSAKCVALHLESQRSYWKLNHTYGIGTVRLYLWWDGMDGTRRLYEAPFIKWLRERYGLRGCPPFDDKGWISLHSTRSTTSSHPDSAFRDTLVSSPSAESASSGTCAPISAHTETLDGVVDRATVSTRISEEQLLRQASIFDSPRLRALETRHQILDETTKWADVACKDLSV